MHRKIEDVINEVHKDMSQKNALEFVEYLKANNAKFHDSDNYFWHPTYKDKELCIINIKINDDGIATFYMLFNNFPSAWITSSVGENNSDCIEFSENECTKKIVWANVRPCEITGCGDCSPGICKTFFDKEFKNLCGYFLEFKNPNLKTMELMKRMIDEIKSDILKNA